MLQKELALSLANVPATQRQQYLVAALRGFPVCRPGPDDANGPAQAGEAQPRLCFRHAGHPGHGWPVEICRRALERLSNAAADLPEEQRDALARKWGKRGLRGSTRRPRAGGG